MSESGRSSDSGLPPPPPSRLMASGVVAGERLPLQRRDRPGLAPGSLTVSVEARAYHAGMAQTAVSERRPSRASAWLPVVAWAALIFAFSSVPSLSSGLGTWDLVLRKLAHVTEYAVLGALLLRACGSWRLALALGVGYAATDELHQHFVTGRHAAVRDVLIDTAGVVIGLAAWSRLAGRRGA